MAQRRIAAAPRLAIAAAVSLAWAIAALVALDPAATPSTSYPAALAGARVADIAAGLGLVLAGVLACTQARAQRLGVLAMLAGVAWLGADWAGAQHGPAVLRSLGAVTAPFALVVVLHLVLTLGHAGRLRSPGARVAIVVAYGIAAAVGVGHALFRDPLLDLYCWRNCRDNALPRSLPIQVSHGALDDVWLWSALAIALGLIAFAAAPAARWRAGRAGAFCCRCWAPATLVAAAEAAYAVGAPAHAAGELPTTPASPRSSSLARSWRLRRSRWRRLECPAGPAHPRRGRAARPSSARRRRRARCARRSRAASATPPSRSVYRRDGRFIDAHGTSDRAAGRRARGARDHSRRASTWRVVLHDAALVDERRAASGRSARPAASRSTTRRCRPRRSPSSTTCAPRARASSRAATPRGAGSSATSTTAPSSACSRCPTTCGSPARRRTADAEELAALLDAAVDEREAALEELRDLAHGIYPAILTEAGLAPALATLAETGAAARRDRGDPGAGATRPPVETAAYVDQVAAIEDARGRAATSRARLGRARRDDRLVRRGRATTAPRRDGAVVHARRPRRRARRPRRVGRPRPRAELPCA